MADELATWDSDTINDLKYNIGQIPLDACETFFSNEVRDFLKDQEKIELDSVTIERDDLSLIAGKNKKSVRNLIFHVGIVTDTTNDISSYDRADAVSGQIMDFFDQYGYFNMKATGITVDTFDRNHMHIGERSGSYLAINETVFVGQP